MKKVTAAIMVYDNRVFIAKRGANDNLAGMWEFPGGKLYDGETPEDCLTRELYEEFRISTSVGEYLGESVYHYDHGVIKLLAYRTFWDGGVILPTVHDEYRFVTLDELGNYTFAPADIPFVERLRRGEIEL